MNKQTEKEELLFRYLLGELSEPEQEEVETRYFEDREFFEDSLVAENELIDAYVRNQLSDARRKHFEEHFLRSPERRNKVCFAETWMAYVSDKPQPDIKTEKTLRRQPWYKRLFEGHRLYWIPAVAMTLLILVVSSLLIERARITRELEQARSERAALEMKEQSLQQQVGEQTARSEQLFQDLEKERDQASQQRSNSNDNAKSAGIIASFTLSPALVRGSGESNVLRIPANATLVRLKLNFQQGNYKSYSASIKTAEGLDVWSQTKLRAQPANGSMSVALGVPPKRLAEADYILTLRGMTESGREEDIKEYAFRVIKK
jgi:anti-sigma factor RsiW